jgi:hypothetical protein
MHGSPQEVWFPVSMDPVNGTDGFGRSGAVLVRAVIRLDRRTTLFKATPLLLPSCPLNPGYTSTGIEQWSTQKGSS